MLQAINIQGTKGVISDASISYLDLVRSSAQHADPSAIVSMDKKPDRLDVRIEPSEPTLKEAIITNLLGFHREMKLKCKFSKSLALQKSVCYSLYYEE